MSSLADMQLQPVEVTPAPVGRSGGTQAPVRFLRLWLHGYTSPSRAFGDLKAMATPARAYRPYWYDRSSSPCLATCPRMCSVGSPPSLPSLPSCLPATTTWLLCSYSRPCRWLCGSLACRSGLASVLTVMGYRKLLGLPVWLGAMLYLASLPLHVAPAALFLRPFTI